MSKWLLRVWRVVVTVMLVLLVAEADSLSSRINDTNQILFRHAVRNLQGDIKESIDELADTSVEMEWTTKSGKLKRGRVPTQDVDYLRGERQGRVIEEVLAD